MRPPARRTGQSAYSKHARDCKGRRLTQAATLDKGAALDARPPDAHVSPCQTAGRPLPAGLARRTEESPGSTGIRCRPTAGGGDLRESATENKPPAHPKVRLQRFARRSAGKGETVRQERTAPLATGAAGQTPPGARPNRGGRRRGMRSHLVPRPQRRSRLVVRVGRVRRAARRVPEEWSSRVDRGSPGNRGNLDGADRTRLTGRLALHLHRA